jgi:hypothetical protein
VGFTISPGLIPGTKLNCKIIAVGKINSKNHQIPAGASKINGSNMLILARRFLTILGMAEIF